MTLIGEVTGDEPLAPAQIREHPPAPRLRFGFFELDAVDADAILALVSD